MATLNVQTDYGAAGDGSTDDTSNIQSAIDDANTGDTIYFPETNGYYAIEGDQALLSIDGDLHPDGLTLEGDGAGSEIRFNGGNTTGTNFYMFRIRDGLQGFKMQDMTLNGGSSNVNGDPVATHILETLGDTPGGQGYTFEDLIIENSYGEGAHFNTQGITVNRCSFLDNGKHGATLDASSTGGSTPTIKNSLFKNNSAIHNGFYAIDAAYGDWLIEDCVFVDNENGFKTIDVGTCTARRLRIKNSGKLPYQTTTGDNSGSGDITFEDVIAENNARVFRLEDQNSFTVPSGSEFVVTNSDCENNNPQIWLLNDATLDVNGELYSNRAGNGSVGFQSTTNGTGSEIATYKHYQNAGGATGSLDNITIDAQVNEDKVNISSVPIESDVGAFTSGGGSSEPDPATFRTDFTEYSGTDNSDFTARWEATHSNFVITDGSTPLDNTYVQLEDTEGSVKAMSWDVPPESSETEVLSLVRVPSNDDIFDSYHQMILRARGTYPDQSFYHADVAVENGDPSLRFRRSLSNSVDTLLVIRSISNYYGNWFYIRFRASGDTLYAKMWPEGDSEPSSWDGSVTDANLPDNGWMGFGGYSGDPQQFAYFSVGVGGETAPLPGDGVLDVRTTPVTAIESQSATLSGTLEEIPSGELAQTFFQWRQTGSNTWTDTSTTDLGSTQSITEDISGLSADTEYEYRAAANRVQYEVSNVGSSNVDSSSATLEGDVTTLQNTDVDSNFQYRVQGNNTWQSTSTQTISSTGTYTDSLSGLTNNETYEWRAQITTNTLPDTDTKQGPTDTFTTGTAATTLDDFESYTSGNKIDAEAAEWGETSEPNPVLDVTANGNLEGSQEVGSTADSVAYTVAQSTSNASTTTDQSATFSSYPSADCTIRAAYYRDDADADYSDFAFGVPSDESDFNKNSYRIRIENSTAPFIRRTVSGSNTQLASMTNTLSDDTLYDLAIEFIDTGSAVDITLRIWEWDGSSWTEHDSKITGSDSNYNFPNGDGIGIGGWPGGNSGTGFHFDNIRFFDSTGNNGTPGWTP